MPTARCSRRLLAILVGAHLARGDYYGPAPNRRLRPRHAADALASANGARQSMMWYIQNRRRMDGVINPFGWNNTEAYVFREDISDEWGMRWDRASENPIDVSRAAAAGVSWNSVAISFKPGFDFDSPLMGEIKGLLSSSDRWVQHEGAQAIISADLKASNERPPLPPEHANDQRFLDQLRTDGFFKIDTSWALSDVVADHTTEQVSRRLGGDDYSEIRHHRVGRGDWLEADEPIPGLQELTARLLPRITVISRSYLGEDSDYNGGYVALRLPARNMDSQEYFSGLWHHDGCGNRIKVRSKVALGVVVGCILHRTAPPCRGALLHPARESVELQHPHTSFQP